MSKHVDITRARQRALARECKKYVGTLLQALVDTYEQWGELDDREQKFCDDYIRDMGTELLKLANSKAKRRR